MHRMIILMVGLLMVAGLAAAREELAGELSPDEIVDRIVELRRELDALLSALPPELRGVATAHQKEHLSRRSFRLRKACQVNWT